MVDTGDVDISNGIRDVLGIIVHNSLVRIALSRPFCGEHCLRMCFVAEHPFGCCLSRRLGQIIRSRPQCECDEGFDWLIEGLKTKK